MSSGDESEQDVLLEVGSGSTRATTLYCIDAGPSMHEINPDSIGKVDTEDEELGETHLTMAVSGVIERIKGMLITNPDDNVGIMLYNTLETDIQPYVGRARSSRHCKVLMPISQVGVQSITQVLACLERIREDGKTWTDMGYAPSPKDPSMEKYIRNAWFMLKQSGKTLRNCVIITNRDDPYGPGRQMDSTSRTMKVISDFSSFNIRWALYAISHKGHKFDNSLFWSYIFSDSHGDEEGDGADKGQQSDVILNAATTFDSFSKDISTKEAVKRTAFSLPMSIGGDDGITCDIQGYAINARAGQRKPIKLYKNPENPTETEKVLPLPYLQCQDTGITINDRDTQTEKVFEFGTTSGVRGHASLSSECIDKLKTSGMESSQLRILGFKDPDLLIRRELNVKHSYFLFPRTSSATNVRIFSALYQMMEKKNRAALGLLKMKKNTLPMFCAIIPQKSQDEPITSEGLCLIPLPFVDDIRRFPEPPKKDSVLTLSATDEETLAMSKVAAKLTLKRSFDPSSYKDPALVYQDLVLLACAFGYETPDPPPDDIAPNYEVVESRASEAISNFNRHLYKDERTSGSSKNVRARIRSQHEAGLLSKMKVDELKEACKAYALPLSGKKAEIVERLDQHLS